MRRLKVLQLVVQPHLIWVDDDDEYEPGPQVQPVIVSLKKLSDLAEQITIDVARVEAEMRTTEAACQAVAEADGEGLV